MGVFPLNALNQPTSTVTRLGAIQFDDVHFHYGRDGFRLRVPRLTVEPGERLAIIGPSGSGKTTLLSLMAGIQVPVAGRVGMGEQCLSDMSDRDRRAFRIRSVGLVFQSFELLEYLTVFENVLLPYRIHPSLRLGREVRQRADQLLGEVGLGKHRGRRIDRLSQGERQRVAICRALVTEPTYLLADEPTGNLDPTLKDQILELLLERQRAINATLVMVTHDHSLLDRFTRTISLDDLTERS